MVSQGDEPLEVTDSSAIFSEFSVVSSSATEPVIRVLHVDSTGDNRSLTVPVGRVFVLEHIQWGGPVCPGFFLWVTSSSEDYSPIRFSCGDAIGAVYTLPSPMKFPAGSKISPYYPGGDLPRSDYRLVLFGYLTDPSALTP